MWPNGSHILLRIKRFGFEYQCIHYFYHLYNYNYIFNVLLSLKELSITKRFSNNRQKKRIHIYLLHLQRYLKELSKEMERKKSTAKMRNRIRRNNQRIEPPFKNTEIRLSVHLIQEGQNQAKLNEGISNPFKNERLYSQKIDQSQ